jgi:hypothetical protein
MWDYSLGDYSSWNQTTAGSAFSLTDAISGSRDRVGSMLKDADCAKAIGARDAASATNRAQRIKIGSSALGNFHVIADAENNPIRIDQNRSAALARYNPGFLGIGRSITLNTAVNWEDPSATMAINQNGTAATYDLLAATAVNVGAASVTAAQFMDLTILHELAHSYGVDHPRTDASAFDSAIWRDCFK